MEITGKEAKKQCREYTKVEKTLLRLFAMWRQDLASVPAWNGEGTFKSSLILIACIQEIRHLEDDETSVALVIVTALSVVKRSLKNSINWHGFLCVVFEHSHSIV